LVHQPKAILYNIDIDLWMMRGALLNFRLASRFSTAYVTIPSEGGAGPPQHVVVLGGRAFIIRANSLIIDVDCIDNWKYSWQWDPPPWQETMKVRGFAGTYEEFRRQTPKKEVAEREERAARAQSEKLLDINLDEAKLHREMLRGPKTINLKVPEDRDRD